MTLLQIEPFGYLIISFGSLLFTLLIARWIFAIDSRIRHEKMQTELLKEIALRQGVSQERINDIIDGWESDKKSSVVADNDGYITP